MEKLKNNVFFAVAVLLVLMIASAALPAVSSTEDSAVPSVSSQTALSSFVQSTSFDPSSSSSPNFFENLGDINAAPDTTTYTVTYEQIEEHVPFLTTRLPVDDLPYKEEKTVTEGAEGLNIFHYETRTYSDGNVERILINIECVRQPINEIIHYGNCPSTPFNEFIYPTTGRLTSLFGYRTLFGVRKFHYGIDIANSQGTSIAASDSGTVVTAQNSSSYGLYIVIDHGNGFSTCYAHLSKICVSVGDQVVRGQEIGKMGSTGISTGNHLHFEIRLDDVRVDPLLYLSGELKETE